MFIKAWPDDNNDDLDDENFKNAQSVYAVEAC